MNKLLVVMLCVALVAGCSKKPEPQVTEEASELEQKIMQFKLTNYTDDGSKKWVLKGDSADVLSEIIYLTDIIVDTYQATKARFTSDDGWYNRKSQVAFLDKNVFLKTDDGIELITDQIEWNGKTDVISTDAPVKVKKSDVIANGIGAHALPAMRQVTLKKNVEVILLRDIMMGAAFGGSQEKAEGAVTTEAKVEITCDGPLNIDYDSNIAVFNDNVKVEDDRGKMFAEVMKAHLDPESKSIVKVVAEGEVRVLRGKDSTYSQKAIYDTASQRIILLGSPEIKIHTDGKSGGSAINKIDKIDW